MQVPKLVVGATSLLYRFVVGAFGKDVPHPYYANFCKPFWIAFFGVTVGLPVVLSGWLIRIIFGRGRAERFGDAVEPFVRAVGDLFFGKIVIIVLAGVVVALVVACTAAGILTIIGFNTALLRALAMAAVFFWGAAALIVVFISLAALEDDDVAPTAKEFSARTARSVWNAWFLWPLRSVLAVAVWFFSSLWRLFCGLMDRAKAFGWLGTIVASPILLSVISGYAVVMAAHNFYKKHCPFVEMP